MTNCTAMNSFKSLDKLAEQIVFYINQLNSGKLSATQIDDLLAEVGQLQERLIILRYKAFEEGNTTPTPIAEETKATAIETPIAFSFGSSPGTPANQVSLIDAIEEVQSSAPEIAVEEPVVEAPAQSEVETVEAPVMAEEKIQDSPVMEVEIPSLVAASVTTGPYYGQKTLLAEEVTLAERLQKSPIGDLTKAIPLADKFVFINELFKQNADDYHSSVDQLNKFDELEEASLFIKEHLMPLYGWKQDDKNVEKFMNLVERRYL